MTATPWLPPSSLRGALARGLGAGLDWPAARPVGGGSISTALVVPQGARRVFVKWLADAPDGFYEAEARGLADLRVALPVPEVLGFAREGRAAAIALTYHAACPPDARAGAAAGRALAALHLVSGPVFGGVPDNFMGRVPQSNAPASAPGYAAFFRERRLAPHLDLLPANVRRRVEALPLERWLSDVEPTLVHGDLWSGNLLFTTDGPRFIDPAAHLGHPLTDLAMMRLFGGLPPEMEAAWLDANPPLRADLDARVAVLQLYPLLIHLRLFGAGWMGDILRTLSALERP